MSSRRITQTRRGLVWLATAVFLVSAFLLCVLAGSVRLPARDALRLLLDAALGRAVPQSPESTILLMVRLPRVLATLLCGAALSLCGAVMQGLLRNPLADGATLGVSSGASLGAMLALLTGFSLPGVPLAGTAVSAVVFAALSLGLVMGLAYALDRTLSTTTIILVGVVLTMFTGSVISLLTTFSGSRLRPLTYWMLGSVASAGYAEALLMLLTLVPCAAVTLLHAPELDAFSLGEENVRHIGVNVRRVKLTLILTVSLLIGVCVSIGGSIGFVGLVIPHIARVLFGPAHRKLLPASLLIGGSALMLSDLAARTLLRPLELPIGVVTSIIGAVFFVLVLFRGRTRWK